MNYPTKPYFYDNPPKEFFVERVKISEILLDDGSEVDISSFKPSGKFYFDRRSVRGEDYDEYYLVEFEEKKTLNPNYTKELAKYEKEKAKFEQEMVQFRKEENIFKAKQAMKALASEKELYERLKIKFEKND